LLEGGLENGEWCSKLDRAAMAAPEFGAREEMRHNRLLSQYAILYARA